MSLVVRGDQSKPPAIIPPAPLKGDDIFMKSFDDSIKMLLEDLYNDIHDFYSNDRDIHNLEDAVQSAFVKEYRNLCEKLMNRSCSNTRLIVDQKEIDGNYEFSLINIIANFRKELQELDHRDRRNLLNRHLIVFKPEIYSLLQEPVKRNRSEDKSRDKPGPRETAAKVDQTAVQLQKKEQTPQDSIENHTPIPKFPTFEEGMESLLKSLGNKIEHEHGFNSYKIISNLFIASFDTLPEKLKSPETDTHKVKAGQKPISYDFVLNVFKAQFKEKLADIGEEALCDALLKALKKTFPQYTQSVLSGRMTPQREVDQWADRFAAARKSKDVDEKADTLKEWCRVVPSSSSLCDSKELWDLFYAIAKSIPFSRGNDPLSIEDDFPKGVFDNMIASLAQNPEAVRTFYKFLWNRTSDGENLELIIKHSKLVDQYPALLDSEIFHTCLSPKIDYLCYSDDAQLPLLALYDKYPLEHYSKEFTDSFLGLFSQLVSQKPDMTPDTYAALMPSLRSMMKKIGAFDSDELNYYLILLSSALAAPLCDLAIELSIPSLQAATRNKKLKMEEQIIHHKFYISTFGKALRHCSREGFNHFWNKGLTKAWMQDLDAYKIDLSIFDVILLATATKFASPIQKEVDPFDSLKPHLQRALQYVDKADDFVKILVLFVYITTDMNDPDAALTLSKRFCTLINLLCKNIPYSDPKNKTSGVMGHQLFWEILRRLAKKANVTPTYRLKYIAALFSTISTLSKNTIYSNPGSYSLILPSLLQAFNRGVEESWERSDPQEAFLLNFLFSQLFINYFSPKDAIENINKILIQEGQTPSESNDIQLDRKELFTFYDYALASLSDTVKVLFRNMQLTVEDLGPDKAHPLYTILGETCIVFKAVWQLPGVPQTLMRKAWNLRIDTYLSAVDLICKTLPEANPAARKEFQGILDSNFSQMIAYLETELKKVNSTTPAERDQFKVNYEYVHQTIVQLLIARKRAGSSSAIINVKPIQLANCLLTNLVYSHEALSFIEKLLNDMTDHPDIFMHDELYIVYIFDKIIAVSDPDYAPGKTSKPSPEIAKNNAVYFFDFLLSFIKKEKSPGAYRIALSLVNRYIQRTASDRLNFVSVVRFMTAILRELNSKKSNPIEYDSVIIQLFKLLIDRMSDDKQVDALLTAAPMTPEQALQNFALMALTKSRNSDLHLEARSLIAKVIECGLVFNSLTKPGDTSAEINKRRDDFRDKLYDFALQCKAFNIAKVPYPSLTGRLSKFLTESLATMPQDESNSINVIEGLKAITELI